jgi:hypothetical protein
VFAQNAGFGSLTSHMKVLLVVAGVLVLLSYSSLLGCASLSLHSLITRRFSRYWTTCFIFCGAAMAGWMAFYAVLFGRGEGIMVFRANIIMFWALAPATLLSAIFGFKYPYKYVAASTVVVIVLAYSYVFRISVYGAGLLWKK